MSRLGTPRPSNGTMFKGSHGSPLVEGVTLVGLASPKSICYLGQRKGFMLQNNDRLLKVRKDGSKSQIVRGHPGAMLAAVCQRSQCRNQTGRLYRHRGDNH